MGAESRRVTCHRFYLVSLAEELLVLLLQLSFHHGHEERAIRSDSPPLCDFVIAEEGVGVYHHQSGVSSPKKA